MTIALLSVDPRTPTRIRLNFTTSLAVGAFTTTSYYTVASLDGNASPTVRAALIVAGAVNNVELVLSSDLISGALYQISAIGVPAQDASVTDGTATTQMRYGRSVQQTNVEPVADGRELILYGRDIVYDGSDFVETSNGDLATVEGTTNVQQAITRRIAGTPLLWDRSYSPDSRQYIDGSTVATVSLKGNLIAQCLKDDRIASADVTLTSDDNDPTLAYFLVEPTLIGGQEVQPTKLPITSQ